MLKVLDRFSRFEIDLVEILKLLAVTFLVMLVPKISVGFASSY